MVNSRTKRVRKWVKPYLRKVKGKKKRKRVRGHYITVFINDYSSKTGDKKE